MSVPMLLSLGVTGLAFSGGKAVFGSVLHVQHLLHCAQYLHIVLFCLHFCMFYIHYVVQLTLVVSLLTLTWSCWFAGIRYVGTSVLRYILFVA